MKFRVMTVAECIGRDEQWRRWFAWRPVRCGAHIIWLETIERRLIIHYSVYWEYREAQ